MRSALFLHDDESLMNRIKITLHDDNASYYFAGSIDEAIAILDGNEIAVIFMPYNFDVLSGNEMIEIVLDHNPKAQIIILFKDSDLSEVVRSHNVYHLCQIICEDFFKIEDLQSILETAFSVYNREEDIKSFEMNYRQKEDKYKKTLQNMSTLLNDRTDSYDVICSVFKDTVDLATDNLTDSESDIIEDYLKIILDDYIQSYLMDGIDDNDFLTKITDLYISQENNRYLKLDVNDEIIKEYKDIRFVIYAITRFFNDFYKKYRGKVELTDQDNYYSLNIVYEALPDISKKYPYKQMLELLEHLFQTFSDKVLYGMKDKIIQYRLMYKKKSL